MICSRGNLLPIASEQIRTSQGDSMVVRTFTLATLFALGCTLIPMPTTRGSLYHPDDPSLNLPVRPDGTGEALPYDDFRRIFAVLANIANSDPNAVKAAKQD